MKTHAICASLLIALTALGDGGAKEVPLFDGKTFNGWNGDTLHTWRIELGVIVGSAWGKKAFNQYLCTDRSYANFILKVKVKLQGSSGDINAGVQFRSKRKASPPNEVEGYQADVAEWVSNKLGSGWGCLWDNSRRNRVLVFADKNELNKILRRSDWNEYIIRCEGKRMRMWLNGCPTFDYTETDERIPQQGVIGLQVYGHGISKAFFKDISIEELP